MPPRVFLETARLTFRRFTPEDAPRLHALHSDPEVMRFISFGQPMPLEDITGRFLPNAFRYYETAEHLGYWAAHEKAAGVFIGWFHLRPNRDVPEDAEVGYRLARQFWGRGYATEGTRALLDVAFRTLGYDRVMATSLATNKASQRVMEKCGLRFEATFTYPEHILPGRTVVERQGVRYGLSREAFLQAGAG